MSKQELEQKKEKKKPKLWVREWVLVPREWREATPEEEKEFYEKLNLFDKMEEEIEKELEKIRKFFKKIREAFNIFFED